MSYEAYEADLNTYNWLMWEVCKHEWPQAIALGRLLVARLAPRSCIDIGCGPGIYLLPFRNAGCEVYGIDGASQAGEAIAPHEFELVDLRKPYTPKKRYDLAMCIEVAEHLKPEYADLIVETVVKCSDAVFWTAAREGQGGEAHWNCQNKPYWIEKFSHHGYGIHSRNDEIMAIINSDGAYSHCGWIQWNGMLFGKQV